MALADYLRRCECVVEVSDRIIDATARPQSFTASHADVELEGYLSVWQAMHPECLLDRRTPLTHSCADFEAVRGRSGQWVAVSGLGTDDGRG